MEMTMDDRLAEIKEAWKQLDDADILAYEWSIDEIGWLITEVERLRQVHEAGVALLTEACRQRSDLADEGTELRAEVERLTNLQSSMVLQAIKAYDDGVAEGRELAAVMAEKCDIPSVECSPLECRNFIAAAIRALTV